MNKSYKRVFLFTLAYRRFLDIAVQKRVFCVLLLIILVNHNYIALIAAAIFIYYFRFCAMQKKRIAEARAQKCIILANGQRMRNWRI